ncbi:MAG: hypothetical protein KGZ81_13515 [Flavobacteriales bacterium]|nr:hypothetical protein [Flavobacteriales bacterium]
MRDFYKNIASGVRVELLDEFDQNFTTRKAFFDKAWPEVRIPNKRGSLMIRSGDLRRSVKAKNEPQGIVFYSSMPYAGYQNKGASIKVSAKSKRFFWAMYYKTAGKKSKAISVEASYWKALALKKVGSKLTIKQRQFIGHHPQVDIAVRRVVDDNFQKYKKELKNTFKP